MKNIRIEKIKLEETMSIRHRVLWPDKLVEHCMVDGDESAAHFGIFYNDVLAGVASTYELDGAVRLRKFAVEKHHQGKGFGKALLEHAMSQAKINGASTLWCDARENAVQFYERFGLSVEGKRFYKSELPYFRMSVEL